MFHRTNLLPSKEWLGSFVLNKEKNMESPMRPKNCFTIRFLLFVLFFAHLFSRAAFFYWLLKVRILQQSGPDHSVRRLSASLLPVVLFVESRRRLRFTGRVVDYLQFYYLLWFFGLWLIVIMTFTLRKVLVAFLGKWRYHRRQWLNQLSADSSWQIRRRKHIVSLCFRTVRFLVYCSTVYVRTTESLRYQ